MLWQFLLHIHLIHVSVPKISDTVHPTMTQKTLDNSFCHDHSTSRAFIWLWEVYTSAMYFRKCPFLLWYIATTVTRSPFVEHFCIISFDSSCLHFWIHTVTIRSYRTIDHFDLSLGEHDFIHMKQFSFHLKDSLGCMLLGRPSIIIP